MGRRGGSVVGEILDDLAEELDNYHGALNELRLGITNTTPRKPIPLMVYEQTQVLGLQLVEGSLMDQPYVWIQQVAVITQKEAQWRRILENATKPNK